jgi:hypothetical protein
MYADSVGVWGIHRRYAEFRPQSLTNQKITEQKFRDYSVI